MWWWLPPNIKLFSVLLHNCNFLTIMICNANICERAHQPQRGQDPPVEKPLPSQRPLLAAPAAIPTTPRVGLGKDPKKDKYNSSVLKQNCEAHEIWHF